MIRMVVATRSLGAIPTVPSGVSGMADQVRHDGLREWAWVGIRSAHGSTDGAGCATRGVMVQ
jgi:hypothetical protein